MSLVDLGKRLLESAKQGNTDDVRTLMSNGAPFTTDWLGTSPLHLAAQNGHLQTVETLLRAGISRDARTKVDRTPLHVASHEGHCHIANLLLEHQANVDAKDMLKMTPLHWAAERGHVEVIELLLKFGADVNNQDKFDRTPIDIPFSNGRADIVQLLQLAPGAKTSDSLKLDMSSDYTHETVVTDTEIMATDLIETVNSVDVGDVVHEVTFHSTDTSSTSVLTTLATLAEATASTKSPNNAETSEALNWLENHGITMIPTTEGSIVASAVESGHCIALTDAGKAALDLIKEESLGEEVTIESKEVEVMVDIDGESDEPQILSIEASHTDYPTTDSQLLSLAEESIIDVGEPPKKRTRKTSGKQDTVNTKPELEMQRQSKRVRKLTIKARDK